MMSLAHTREPYVGCRESCIFALTPVMAATRIHVVFYGMLGHI